MIRKEVSKLGDKEQKKKKLDKEEVEEYRKEG